MSKLKESKTTPTKIDNISLATKEGMKNKIPEGSEILSKKVNISVEEIENGYITNKSYDIKYQAPNKEYTDYCYYTVKIYSEENPLQVTVEAAKEHKQLADLFEG